MQDYFGYRILYAMNITDVDDKIIKRARTQYLLDQYKQLVPFRSQDAIHNISVVIFVQLKVCTHS